MHATNPKKSNRCTIVQFSPETFDRKLTNPGKDSQIDPQSNKVTMMKIEMDQEVESTMTEPLIETGNHGDEEEDLVKFKEQDEKPSIFSGERPTPKDSLSLES